MDELQKGRDGWRSLWRWWIEEFLDGFAVQEMTSDEIGDRVQADASGKHGLLSDSDQQEGDQGRDDLKLDGILRGTQELLDPKVLLDPLEEQLDLPAGLIEVGNFAGWGDEIVGEDAHTGAVVFQQTVIDRILMAHGLGSRCCLERLATFETNRIQAMQPVQEILYRTAVGLTRESVRSLFREMAGHARP